MKAARPVLLLAVLSLGCGLFESGVTFAHGAVALVSSIEAEGWPTDVLFVDSVTTSFGGPLRVHVTYGGGCGENRVALMVETNFAESAPPLLRARLAHTAGPYQCRALLRETIDFDLAIVRSHFRATYPSSAHVFALDVQGTRVTHAFR
jgi:hypothetical protein